MGQERICRLFRYTGSFLFIYILNKHIYLKCTTWWFDILIEMITAIKLISVSFHTVLGFFYFFFICGEGKWNLLHYFHYSMQYYPFPFFNTVLSTIFIMTVHYISRHSHHVSAALYPLTSPTTSTPNLLVSIVLLCFFEFNFF